MKSFLRYILSLRNYRRWKLERKLNKLKPTGGRVYLTALLGYIESYPRQLSFNERSGIIFDMRTHDIGELMTSLSELHHCIISTGSDKYYKDLPSWFVGTSESRNLIDYATSDGYFTDIESAMSQIIQLVKEINYAMNTCVETDMIPYYDKKARQLYQELIQLCEALK